MDRLDGFQVILDGQAVADDLRLAFLKGSVQIQGAVCQRNAVGDGREVLHLRRQFQNIHDIADPFCDICADMVMTSTPCA